ncbi:MAG: hypothetical protein IJZ47_11115 [Oscillospiraceae bacterium]|nr:hypothetical protein [Oscillospiraceae bacterium]
MNEKDYEKLLSSASSKLGTSPEKLRQTLEKGDVASLTGGLSKADKAKLKAVLGNKELMDKLKKAGSPQEVMKLLSGM